MNHLKVFSSKTCAPCQRMKPWIGELELTVVHVDVFEEPSIAAIHNVRSVPTFKFYEDDKLVRSHIGAMTKAGLHAFVK